MGGSWSTASLSSFPKGPLKLGDPYYRGLSKMETDPMITQRMRDISRTLCKEAGDILNECGKKHGLMLWYHCQSERDGLTDCMARWQNDPDFKEAVTEVRVFQSNRKWYA